MKLDPKKTALLTLDLQQGIIGMAPGGAAVIPTAAKAVDLARRLGWQIIHVGLGFSPGHPEIPDFESPFLMVKTKNVFVRGTPSAEFPEAIAKPGDLIVYKQRVSAFSDNALEMILRARGIDHLVFFGIATSGIVLSTVRRAFDLDFRSIILKDACFDADAEVHQVLTEKVFPRQAKVLTVDELIAAQEPAA